MDLRRMLNKCRRDQWSVDDLDWSTPPRPMSRSDEEAIVQYFTNMAGIERLAAALFREQRDRAQDPVLREVFQSFVIDEMRHAEVACRLAHHYDVHRYRTYEVDRALQRFSPHFVAAVRHLSEEVANLYITTGELILDVALLRSLDDYVADATSHGAMERINQDESRHIAVDFHMVEYYSSPEYLEELRRRPAKALSQRLRAWWALGNMFYFAAPFFREVFFQPMDLLDPGGRRIREAFKRIQLLGTKRRVAERPFNRFVLSMQALYQNRATRPTLGWLAVRVLGLRPQVLERLYDEAEARRARAMSFDALAEEALAAKLAS
jgi:hypothetical protein